MYKCYFCNNLHDIINKDDCIIFLDRIITRFKNNNVQELMKEIENIYINKKLNITKISNKKDEKYLCKHCNKKLSSHTNYKKHINNNSCKKISIEHKCTKCNKIFREKKNLDYHIIHNVCNKKEQKNQIINIDKHNIQNIINNNQQNIINNNQQNIDKQNIQNITNNNQQNFFIAVNNSDDFKKVVELIPFRNVNYNLTPEKYFEYASNPEQAIKKFIKDEHFNLNKPNRMNIHNTNARSNRVQIFDKDDDDICRWMTKDKATISELLYDRGVNHLFVAKNIIELNGYQLDARKERKLQDKIKEYETDEKIKKEYINMISDMTYDYRQLVDDNKKKINNQLLIKNN